MSIMQRTRNIILDACLDIAERSDHGLWDEDLMASYIALAGVEQPPRWTLSSPPRTPMPPVPQGIATGCRLRPLLHGDR